MLLLTFYLFLFLLLVAIILIYFKLIRPAKRIYNELRSQGIKGEPFIPLIGQIVELVKRREKDELMDYHEDLFKKYGNVYMFGFGPLIHLIVLDPDLLADVLSRNNAANYRKGADFTAVFVPIVGYNSLLVAEGSVHERSRRMINPAFHHVNLKSMISIITDRTARAIDLTMNDEKLRKPVDLVVFFNDLTLAIISACAFGVEFETNLLAKDILCGTSAEITDITEYRSMRLVNQIPFLANLPFWRKRDLDAGVEKVAKFVQQIITNRRHGKSSSLCSGADILDLLLSAVDDDGKSFSDQEIKDQSLTFVLAGSETTGNLMTWLLYVLMTDEKVLEACREEVDRVVPNGTELTNELLADLLVCEAVINETLRLYPPAAFFGRQCEHEHFIGTERKICIPRGVIVVVNNYVLHRRSDMWPRPNEFDYTRWLRDPTTGLKPKLSHPYAFLPFAAGPRNCIGQNFALLEAKVMLALFIQQCNFDIVPGQKITPDVKITMRPKYGLWANITKRAA